MRPAEGAHLPTPAVTRTPQGAADSTAMARKAHRFSYPSAPHLRQTVQPKGAHVERPCVARRGTLMTQFERFFLLVYDNTFGTCWQRAQDGDRYSLLRRACLALRLEAPALLKARTLRSRAHAHMHASDERSMTGAQAWQPPIAGRWGRRSPYLHDVDFQGCGQAAVNIAWSAQGVDQQRGLASTRVIGFGCARCVAFRACAVVVVFGVAANGRGF